ncbi:hypothetical protein SKAU_G00291920 [Synaphobranchus kaupii]|uniref:Uncharacterized protein n=1 Tax=Synaphobranchus kaupii TaxID=118154 RepID=A0A9Q1IM65_SYNKA|nr:hypothetical protein SKAU_G00291920 [Synaphobranchus kaupii]
MWYPAGARKHQAPAQETGVTRFFTPACRRSREAVTTRRFETRLIHRGSGGLRCSKPSPPPLIRLKMITPGD